MSLTDTTKLIYLPEEEYLKLKKIETFLNSILHDEKDDINYQGETIYIDKIEIRSKQKHADVLRTICKISDKTDKNDKWQLISSLAQHISHVSNDSGKVKERMIQMEKNHQKEIEYLLKKTYYLTWSQFRKYQSYARKTNGSYKQLKKALYDTGV